MASRASAPLCPPLVIPLTINNSEIIGHNQHHNTTSLVKIVVVISYIGKLFLKMVCNIHFARHTHTYVEVGAHAKHDHGTQLRDIVTFQKFIKKKSFHTTKVIGHSIKTLYTGLSPNRT